MAQKTIDFLWIKNRSSALHHRLFDSIRGANKTLFSSTTDAEYTDNDQLMSFDNDGFTLGSDTGVNQSSNAIVGWSWLAGGSASSNSNGSITSSVSANTEAGFSIVTYTGSGSNATIGHGLSSAPEFVVVKCRSNSISAPAWPTWASAIAGTEYLDLSGTGAKATAAAVWNSTIPTSSVFSVGTTSSCNSSGFTYVAYCFHSVDGYSKVGSYTGNGSADGPFVYTGFRPAWLLVKRTDSTSNWLILDNKREGFNPDQDGLDANGSGAEGTAEQSDFLSNGFKVRNNSTGSNASGGNFIYLAFAEQPAKYSNAR